jgi:Abortive infection alpha
MTGGEIMAAGKAAEAIGKSALGEDEKTKDVLLRVAQNTPEMRAAARSMAARTAVKERVKLKLYQPFARMIGVSQAYFEDTFPQEMGAKVYDVPDENLITPAASVAVPALQGLSYTFGEPDLKEMYLNLLATASDDRQADQAHPAFADIIKQLAPRETQLLNLVLASWSVVAVRVKDQLNDPRASFRVLMSHLLPIADDTGEPTEELQVPTWVDNWQRLGLVNVTYSEHRADKDAYAWVETRPEYIRLNESPGIINLRFDKGLIRTTDFGRQFFRAVTE